MWGLGFFIFLIVLQEYLVQIQKEIRTSIAIKLVHRLWGMTIITTQYKTNLACNYPISFASGQYILFKKKD